MTQSRHLAWQGALNIRDLGGYPTIDGAETAWGIFVRGDNLCKLTDAGCGELAAYGIRTIIDLRSASELSAVPHPFSERRAAEHEGIAYINTPIIDDGDVRGAGPMGRIRSLQEMYDRILDWYGMRLGNALRAAAEAPGGGVLFHCHAGKDRTGLMAMFLLSLAGVDEATISADYALSNTYLGPLHSEIMANLAHDPAEQRRVAVLQDTKAEIMDETQALISSRYGGVSSYLASIDVTPEQQAILRRRLRGEA